MPMAIELMVAQMLTLVLSDEGPSTMHGAKLCAARGALQEVSFDKRDQERDGGNNKLNLNYYCVCKADMVCRGTQCSHGHRNSSSTPAAAFETVSAGKVTVSGFRVDCLDCRCGNKVPQKQKPPPPPMTSVDGVGTVALAAAAAAAAGAAGGGSGGPAMLVTAASENHLCVLLQLLDNLRKTHPDRQVLVYDLDLAPSPGTAQPPHYIKREHLDAVHPNIAGLRRFNYSKYPTHFRIDKHAGVYAWKPIIIREAVKEFGAAICKYWYQLQ